MTNRFVLLDAVGTVIFPDPPVAKAYYQAAISHAAQISEAEIKTRFPHAVSKYYDRKSGVYHLPCSDESDRLLWQQIVKEVFDEQYSEELFEDLWSHFAAPHSWSTFPDVNGLIKNLQDCGFSVGIASNFDSRLAPIVRHLIPEIRDDQIFYSTKLGFAKPDVRFFKAIEARVHHTESSRFLMIGDHWSLDFEAARRAGWSALWKSGSLLPTVDEITNQF